MPSFFSNTCLLPCALLIAFAGCTSAPPAGADAATDAADAASATDTTAPDTALSTDASDAFPTPDASDVLTPADAVVDTDAAPVDAGPAPSAEFVALYDGFLTAHCGGSTCHMPGTHESSYFGYAPRLQMPDARRARAALVNQVTDCISAPNPAANVRVVPGDANASLVMLAASDGLCTRRHNAVVPELTPSDLAPLAAWINAGAH